jgi:hypothetical protein
VNIPEKRVSPEKLVPAQIRQCLTGGPGIKPEILNQE